MADELRELLTSLPAVQVKELHRLVLLYPGAKWHLNDCGCCICLHPDGEDNTHGFIINADGDSGYVGPDE